MRRNPVHRVYIPSERIDGNHATRCGIIGGTELLRLNGQNNGSGRRCGACYPDAKPERRQRPVPTGRWW